MSTRGRKPKQGWRSREAAAEEARRAWGEEAYEMACALLATLAQAATIEAERRAGAEARQALRVSHPGVRRLARVAPALASQFEVSRAVVEKRMAELDAHIVLAEWAKAAGRDVPRDLTGLPFRRTFARALTHSWLADGRAHELAPATLAYFGIANGLDRAQASEDAFRDVKRKWRDALRY